MNNVIKRPFNLSHLENLAEEILTLIYSKSNQITVAEAIGVLEIVKLSIIEEQKDVK